MTINDELYERLEQHIDDQFDLQAAKLLKQLGGEIAKLLEHAVVDIQVHVDDTVATAVADLSVDG